jgi:hypothetical protein
MTRAEPPTRAPTAILVATRRAVRNSWFGGARFGPLQKRFYGPTLISFLARKAVLIAEVPGKGTPNELISDTRMHAKLAIFPNSYSARIENGAESRALDTPTCRVTFVLNHS